MPKSTFTTFIFLRYHHNIHKSAEEKVIKALEARGVETKKVQRMNYTNDLIDWADVIFTTGGDGTFLLGASKVRNPNIPVIGINTDPTRSEGYLCIPKHFSFSLDHAIEMLLGGHFRYFLKTILNLNGSFKMFDFLQMVLSKAIENHPHWRQR